VALVYLADEVAAHFRLEADGLAVDQEQVGPLVHGALQVVVAVDPQHVGLVEEVADLALHARAVYAAMADQEDTC
jgi:hypothetical protein